MATASHEAQRRSASSGRRSELRRSSRPSLRSSDFASRPRSDIDRSSSCARRGVRGVPLAAAAGRSGWALADLASMIASLLIELKIPWCSPGNVVFADARWRTDAVQVPLGARRAAGCIYTRDGLYRCFPMDTIFSLTVLAAMALVAGAIALWRQRRAQAGRADAGAGGGDGRQRADPGRCPDSGGTAPLDRAAAGRRQAS